MTSPTEIDINPAPVLIASGQLQPEPDVLVIPVPGPQGEQGPAGAGVGYDHTQGSASATWIINHNLGYKPGVSVVVANEQVITDVVHGSVNTTTITFASPQTGSAYLI